MAALEFKILAKRQDLRDLLKYALQQAPVYLPVIRNLKAEILICDAALQQLSFRRARTHLG
jgi:hypothetical protein